MFDEVLNEDFYTIQGEGFHAGKPAYFIRLGGCDVGCRWCDAKYTWNPKLYPPVDVQTVIDRATACPAQAERESPPKQQKAGWESPRRY